MKLRKYSVYLIDNPEDNLITYPGVTRNFDIRIQEHLDGYTFLKKRFDDISKFKSYLIYTSDNLEHCEFLEFLIQDGFASLGNRLHENRYRFQNKEIPDEFDLILYRIGKQFIEKTRIEFIEYENFTEKSVKVKKLKNFEVTLLLYRKDSILKTEFAESSKIIVANFLKYNTYDSLNFELNTNFDYQELKYIYNSYKDSGKFLKLFNEDFKNGC